MSVLFLALMMMQSIGRPVCAFNYQGGVNVDLCDGGNMRNPQDMAKQYDIVDVPAISVEHEEKMCITDPCGMFRMETRTHWTCADKSRILLTAEDGTKHCISFKGQK